jgi:type II secretory pathway pseudopilin PulG
MTHTLIKRGQARGQGGFAIGLILLVVLLIAVIIAAIALATRNSSNKGNEKDRVAASNLIQQAVSLDQGAQRISAASGLLPWQLITVRSTAAADVDLLNSLNNIWGPNGAFPTHLDVDTSLFDGKCVGLAYVNNASPADTTDVSAGGCQWHVTTTWGSRPAASPIYNKDEAGKSAVGVLYTFPLRGSIASQINNVLWATQVGDPLFAVGGTAEVSLGHNSLVSTTPTEDQPIVAAARALTVAHNTISASTAAGTSTAPYFKPFGLAPSTLNGSPTIVATTAVIDSMTPNSYRFPYIGAGERLEGVVQVGGSQIFTDTEEKFGTLTTGVAGVRAYYRSLNSPLVD